MLFPETLKDMNSFSQFQKNPNKQINKQTKKKENNNNNNNNKTTTEKPVLDLQRLYMQAMKRSCSKSRISNKYIFKTPLQITTLFCSSNYLLDVYLRERPHERRNELKPIWDFISVENIQFGVQSALYLCSHECSMKLKPVWISYRSFWPKWNFKQTWDFHVNKIYPKRNE